MKFEKTIGKEKFEQTKKNKSIIECNKEEKISNQKDKKSYTILEKKKFHSHHLWRYTFNCDIENAPQKDLSSVPINEWISQKLFF